MGEKSFAEKVIVGVSDTAGLANIALGFSFIASSFTPAVGKVADTVGRVVSFTPIQKLAEMYNYLPPDFQFTSGLFLMVLGMALIALPLTLRSHNAQAKR